MFSLTCHTPILRVKNWLDMEIKYSVYIRSLAVNQSSCVCVSSRADIWKAGTACQRLVSYQDWQEKFLLKLLHRRVSICSNRNLKNCIFVYTPSLTSPLLSDQVKQRMIEGRNLDSREQKFQDVGSNTVLTSCRMLRSCWRWFIVACVRVVWQYFIFKNIPCGQHIREK